jgi:hypothetical protein
VTTSLRDPRFREAGWSVPDDATVSNGSVSRDSLLRTYRRRLRRVGENVELREATEALISFLEQYPEEELHMVSCPREGAGTRLFLADADSREILHWMSMFG